MATVSLPGLLIFTNQFSAMMGSQLPLLSVLQNLGRETPQRRFREVLEDIERRSGLEVLDLPMIEPYHIELGFALW